MPLLSTPICPKCSNPLRETFKEVYMGLGVYKKKPSGEYECPYCIWKGDAGPGAQLKELIKRRHHHDKRTFRKLLGAGLR